MPDPTRDEIARVADGLLRSIDLVQRKEIAQARSALRFHRRFFLIELGIWLFEEALGVWYLYGGNLPGALFLALSAGAILPFLFRMGDDYAKARAALKTILAHAKHLETT